MYQVDHLCSVPVSSEKKYISAGAEQWASDYCYRPYYDFAVSFFEMHAWKMR